MRAVGLTQAQMFQASIIDNVNARFMEMSGQIPTVRRSDYPHSTELPAHKDLTLGVLENAIINRVIVWQCGPYTKYQVTKDHVWIEAYRFEPDPPGGGHQALRRLGWHTKYIKGEWEWRHRTKKELPF